MSRYRAALEESFAHLVDSRIRKLGPFRPGLPCSNRIIIITRGILDGIEMDPVHYRDLIPFEANFRWLWEFAHKWNRNRSRLVKEGLAVD